MTAAHQVPFKVDLAHEFVVPVKQSAPGIGVSRRDAAADDSVTVR